MGYTFNTSYEEVWHMATIHEKFYQGPHLDSDGSRTGDASPHSSLADRFSGYSGDYVPTEWDTGTPVGKEI